MPTATRSSPDVRQSAQPKSVWYERLTKAAAYSLPEIPIILAALIYTNSRGLQRSLGAIAFYYPYAMFAAGLLLGWRLHRSRLLVAQLVRLDAARRSRTARVPGRGGADGGGSAPVSHGDGALVLLVAAPGVPGAVRGPRWEPGILHLLFRHLRAHPHHRGRRGVLSHGVSGQPHAAPRPARPERGVAAAWQPIHCRHGGRGPFQAHQRQPRARRRRPGAQDGRGQARPGRGRRPGISLRRRRVRRHLPRPT